ncbi:MAG: hypothetical protein LBU41_04020 [Clostridiales Family XIII bacterium]|jgi:hypothetical protein|nr:hypothetical protein [Clostridiales Family XIII bacterium]
MALFNKKKKRLELQMPPNHAGDAVNDELLAVLTAAVSAYDNAELIAVISAAIAAYEENDAQTDLVIRRIDRRYEMRPAWGVAGNRESIDARRM